MNKIIIQPASGPEPMKHFKNTIEKGVSLNEISSYLSSEEIKQLKSIYSDSLIFIWGVVPGKNDANVDRWKKVEISDVALFYQQGFLTLMAHVSLKIHNEPLAEILWGRDRKEQTWEYIYFIIKRNRTKIPIKEFNKIVGYANNYFPQYLINLNSEQTARLCSGFPEIKRFYEEAKKGIPKIKLEDIITFEEFQKIQKNREKEASKLSNEELKKRALKTSKKSGKRDVVSKQYDRNPYVATFAKRRANGICQLCSSSSPFNDKSGQPFLEAHHIKWLSRDGEDTIDNTVALCPNCHRKMHILDLDEDMTYLYRQTSAIEFTKY